MDIRFEFLTLFREKTGSESITIQIEDNRKRCTIFQALRALEEYFADGTLSLLESSEIRRGVLVFIKKPGGALKRVFNAKEKFIDENQTIVLAAAMGGG